MIRQYHVVQLERSSRACIFAWIDSGGKRTIITIQDPFIREDVWHECARKRRRAYVIPLKEQDYVTGNHKGTIGTRGRIQEKELNSLCLARAVLKLELKSSTKQSLFC